VQNLLAKWGQLFRHFAPPNLGQRHFPLYEASLLSMRTIESPFISFLFCLLLFCGKIVFAGGRVKASIAHCQREKLNFFRASANGRSDEILSLSR
jgi:hypothetical protein